MMNEITNLRRSHGRLGGILRTAGSAGIVVLLLGLLGCAGVQTPPEPEATPPSPPVASASVAVPGGETPIVLLKGLLADPRAKPVLLGAELWRPPFRADSFPLIPFASPTWNELAAIRRSPPRNFR